MRRRSIARYSPGTSCHAFSPLCAPKPIPRPATGAGRVGTLEDPVLPQAEPAENAGLHRFRPGEAQIGFEPGEGIGRKARPLLEREADLVVPIDLIVARGDEPERRRAMCVDRVAD